MIFMTAIVKTKEIIYDSNLAANQSYIYISRKVDPHQNYMDWKYKDLIHWSKYQIKETDMRQKTSTFTSPNYFDLTTGVFCVLITSPFHEDFGGMLISVDFDEETGLYSYQCQDWSRAYQSKVSLINGQGKSVHRLLQYLITRGGVSTIGALSKASVKAYSKILSGLRPAYQYEQKYYGSIINFNPMTLKSKMIIKNKSWIEAIRDLVFGSGAYVDVYFDKYGIIHIEPYHKDDLYNTGLYLTTKEVASRDFKFDTTNIITGVVVESNDKLNSGNGYSSKSILNLDLSAFFGDVGTMISNPNQSTSSSNGKSTGKKATTATKTSNPYGTKKKVVWLNIDVINGYSSDMKKMKDIAAILRKNGWTVHITGVGSEAHYQQRGKCKNGIWFTLYGGACAGTLREAATSSWYRNPLTKNGSRTVVGFFPPAGDIRKGGKYYKYLPKAHDDGFSNSNPGISYPANFLTKHKIPFMYAKSAKEMVAKFLAGGDNKGAL